jgi:hypothetical protein
MKKRIKIVQRLLQEKGLYDGIIDGIAGPVTMRGLARFEELHMQWSKSRQLIGFIQIAANEKNIDAGPVDGLWGPRTQAAFEELSFVIEHGQTQPLWRPEEITVPNPNEWPLQHSPEFNQIYGGRGSGLKTVDLPYEMNLSWRLYTRVRRVTCHEKISESLLRVLQKVCDTYSESEIRQLRLNHFGGGYNNRKMRNGSLWSMHAWGIAFDFDPNRNQLTWGRDKAAFSHPDYNEWWNCWEEEGWVSLGRRRNFDWMHIQAARLPE